MENANALRDERMPLDVISYLLAEGKASWSDVKSNLKSEGAYNLLSKSVATIVVAASDSKNKEKADYVCDGVADEEEIELALSELGAEDGQVFLLEGTYHISSPIDILKSNVALVGAGWGTKLLLDDGANCRVIIVGDNANQYENIIIANLQIDGNKLNQSDTSHGIAIYGASGAKILRCLITNTYIHDCHNAGVYLKYADYCRIVHNLLQNNDYYGVGGGYVYYAVIAGNELSGGGDGIYLYYTYYSVILANTISSCTYEGIAFIGDDSVIIGNVCEGNGQSGIALSYASRNTIIGNRCRNNAEYGVKILNAECDSNLIGKNYLTGNTSGAISDAGTGTILGVFDTANNNDNVV